MSLLSFMEAMSTSNIPLIAAFFIGLMTAISPCPLATNLTAVAYISRKLGKAKASFLVGLSYTLGRAFTYVATAMSVVFLGVNVQLVSGFLQKYGEALLGPFLILSGIVLIELIKMDRFFQKGELGFAESLKKTLFKRGGVLGAFLLGAIFALAFCPFSAVLYFGMLIPLAVGNSDGLLIPLSFAIGTGLPVILLSVAVSAGAGFAGKTIGKLQKIEGVVRKLVGAIFILVGAYYSYLAIAKLF